MKKLDAREGQPASTLISKKIADLGDWRGKTLQRMRKLIHEADPDVVEELKWRGTPVWSHDGILCTGETYKKVVKLTFAKGASLKDPARLFNSSLEGNTRRAIDLAEGEAVDASAFKALIREAVDLNASGKRRPGTRARPPVKAGAKAGAKPGAKTPPVKLLSGGNPQIAKGDGDAPVEAYIAALPGWKREVARRLDTLIARNVPNVRKGVRWNSPFYGIEGHGWFLGVHAFTRYLKVTFFRGTSLRPLPPGESKSQEVRYLDLHEDEPIDQAQLSEWIRQAAALPGWSP